MTSKWEKLLGTTETSFKIGLNKAVFDASGLSVSRTYTLPNVSGTVPLLENAQTWTAAQTINEFLVIEDADDDGSTIVAFTSSDGYEAATGFGWRIQSTADNTAVNTFRIQNWNGTSWGIAFSLTASTLSIGGSNVLTTATGQPLDATLTALAGQNWAANALPIGSGADTLAQVSFAANTFPARASSGNLVAKAITDFGLSLVDDANAGAALTTLGVTADAQSLLADADVPRLGTVNTWTDEQTENLASSIKRHRIISAGAGQTSVAQTHGGLILHTTAMNLTNKYGIGLLFGSADADFTTTNPKFLAGIVPYATENYTGDTTGGMALEFFGAGNTPGATPTPTSMGTATTSGWSIALATTATAVTQASSDDSTKIATTEFVQDVVAGIGALSDGDKGDITVASGGTAWTVDNNAVTYAKLQDASAGNVVLARAAATSGDYSEVALAASRLLGRGSTGDVAALTVGNDLSFNGAVLQTKWTTVLKAADQARASVTALADDDTLVIPMTAGKYIIRGHIFYTIANATMDFKYGIAYSGSMTTHHRYIRSFNVSSGSGTDSVTESIDDSLVASQALTVTSVTHAGMLEVFIIATPSNSGTWSFQWAQNTSDPGNAIVLGGSYLEYLKVS
jgi:hypothetical protein